MLIANLKTNFSYHKKVRNRCASDAVIPTLLKLLTTCCKRHPQKLCSYHLHCWTNHMHAISKSTGWIAVMILHNKPVWFKQSKLAFKLLDAIYKLFSLIVIWVWIVWVNGLMENLPCYKFCTILLVDVMDNSIFAFRICRGSTISCITRMECYERKRRTISMTLMSWSTSLEWLDQQENGMYVTAKMIA